MGFGGESGAALAGQLADQNDTGVDQRRRERRAGAFGGLALAGGGGGGDRLTQPRRPVTLAVTGAGLGQRRSPTNAQGRVLGRTQGAIDVLFDSRPFGSRTMGAGDGLSRDHHAQCTAYPAPKVKIIFLE